MEDKALTSFLGRGWSFPPSFSRTEKTTMMSELEEDINHSLEILLSTRPDERIMQLDYGCDLTPLLYEPITLTLKTHMKELIQTAILLFEPRITPEEVIIEDASLEGVVKIVIEYTVKATNARNNMVYPFYLNEGTNVD